MITNIENELLDVNKRTQPIIYTTDSIGFALNDRNCAVICILPCLIPQSNFTPKKSVISNSASELGRILLASQLLHDRFVNVTFCIYQSALSVKAAQNLNVK